MNAIKTGVSWRPESYVPFQVTTTIPNRGGFVQITIVTEYGNLFDLQDALIEDGAVYGARLILDREEGQKSRRVQNATPYVLGKGGVAAIAPIHFALDESEVAQVLYDFDWGTDREDGEDGGE